MRVEIITPDEYMGDVIGDINSRRGKVSEMQDRHNAKLITAFIPLSSMFGYVKDLRSMSQGRAQYSMFFARYERVPENVVVNDVKR
ncbi:elongation factor G family protein [Anaplasma phagocytophilum str. CR1007]|nr:elongation factor G family protein [Anaplasma phagocytophilum str. CR1007]